MKSEITMSKEPYSKFPKLRTLTDGCRSNGTIVLFDKPGSGTVIYPTGIYKVGEYSTDWCDSSFTDFNGKVTLSND